MMKFFSIYGAVVLLAFVVGSHEGYAVSSLFGKHHHGKPGEQGYSHGSSYFYHK